MTRSVGPVVLLLAIASASAVRGQAGTGWAGAALAKGEGRLMQEVRTLLRSPCASQRGWGMAAVGWLGLLDAGLYPMVRNALDSADEAVRRGAIRALGAFPAEAAQSLPRLQRLLGQGEPETLAALAALASLGEAARPSVPAVAEQLLARSERVRLMACTTLRRLRPELAAPLREVRGMVRGQVGGWAVGISGCCGCCFGRPAAGDAIPRILGQLEVLATGDTPSRLRALRGISRTCGDSDMEILGGTVLPAVVGALNDSVPDVRDEALKTLSALAGEEPWYPRRVAAMLGDGDAGVRQLAASLLTWIDDPQARTDVMPALAGGLEDPDRYVRRACAETLASFGPNASRAIPALLRMLRHPDRSSRVSAAKALGQLDVREARHLIALCRSLEDPAVQVVVATAESLAALAPRRERVLESLLANRHHRSSAARRGILAALSAIAPRRGDVLVVLIEHLADEAKSVREESATLLWPVLTTYSSSGPPM